MIEEYEKRAEDAKGKRMKLLERFHIGDTVYPYWLTNLIVYGTVIDIDTVTRKVICDFNGVRRQFEPEDLMIINPNFARDSSRKASVRRAAVRLAAYYESSPSNYRISEDERESGEVTCPKCGSVMHPSFDANEGSEAMVCPDCGRRIVNFSGL